MQHHIAIVEDEDAIAANYRDALQRNGFRVSLYSDQASASAAFRQQLPDLAIIDIELGDDIEGGFELCRDLRSRSPALPIVFLTARDSELDKISGLRLGANDYWTKDISLPYMLARIVALFAWVKALRVPEQPEDIMTEGGLMLNVERLTCTWRDITIDMTHNEFRMVKALVNRPGHVKTRDQLMDAAGVVQADNSITSSIKRIRRKFVEVDDTFDHIKAVHGVGYRWSGE
jgi:two-component system OmpR family response regulator